MGKRHGKQHAIRTPPQAENSPPTPAANRFWHLVALPTLAGLVVVACVWLLFPASATPPPKPKAKQPWQPRTDDDRLVEAFRKARNEDGKGGTDLLAADPVFDVTVPVSETEAESRQAGYFLHRAPKVVSIRGGEPAPGGRWLDTPGRYTLATPISASTPELRIQIGARVESPSRLSMFKPDIVVEVRDGKIYALRAELQSD